LGVIKCSKGGLGFSSIAFFLDYSGIMNMDFCQKNEFPKNRFSPNLCICVVFVIEFCFCCCKSFSVVVVVLSWGGGC
jgi:hypothetical protein